MRPDNSKSTSPDGDRKPGAAQAASNSVIAAAVQKRRTGLLETLQRFLQRLVLGADLERLLPDLARLVALAEHPSHYPRGDPNSPFRRANPARRRCATGPFRVPLREHNQASESAKNQVFGR